MSLTVTIIAKLSQTDFRTAKRALETAMAFDGDANAAVPEEFTHGAGARCYALATIAEYRPALFWCGLFAVALIPVLAAVKVLHG
ncbi:hypothetical protein P9250_31960 [Caballeronia sp. LP006]|jgi:hypothetical protein|uniref:hypothetical protein n=2 Tax=Caballeronia TaxID=1827195 RepID=UPI0007C72352|nr:MULTISPECIES: hypothetical protein [unclassified Caballeronia]MDR5832466.1 hypothetical protein [Caballeronia sp. LP006]MDR5851826.1 hypothetical protein [Caballeronia sp. LZ003]